MKITDAECEAILEKVSGSSNPVIQKIDELITAIQGGEEIEYVNEEDE
jgi:hypothetical protein